MTNSNGEPLVGNDRLIRVLMAEDSPTVAELLARVIQQDKALLLVGVARDGAEAVHLALSTRPDVITMDVEMPILDGLEATRQILQQRSIPIVVVSAMADSHDKVFNILQAGALTVVPKPIGGTARDLAYLGSQVINTIKMMARTTDMNKTQRHGPIMPTATPIQDIPRESNALIAVGSSAGGPAALTRLLADFPADFPAPIVCVQHMPNGFIGGLASWLNARSPLTVKVAEHAERVQPGFAYIAPDDQHMSVVTGGVIRLHRTPPVEGHRPSVTRLFESVAQTYGYDGIGVILTGMGRDGATGLQQMRQAGAETLAEDESTATVFGMPRVALEIGAARLAVPIDKMAAAVVKALRERVQSR